MSKLKKAFLRFLFRKSIFVAFLCCGGCPHLPDCPDGSGRADGETQCRKMRGPSVPGDGGA